VVLRFLLPFFFKPPPKQIFDRYTFEKMKQTELVFSKPKVKRLVLQLLPRTDVLYKEISSLGSNPGLQYV